MIDWTKCTKAEHDFVVRIAKRAAGLGFGPAMDIGMDVEACHVSGCPLNLSELADADDGNFGHDVAGIMNHIDRTTGALRDCFSPRYSA